MSADKKSASRYANNNISGNIWCSDFDMKILSITDLSDLGKEGFRKMNGMLPMTMVEQMDCCFAEMQHD